IPIAFTSDRTKRNRRKLATEKRNQPPTEGNATNNSPYAVQAGFDAELASTVISLLYEDAENPARNIAVAIAPDLGSNLFRFRVGEYDIIYCEPDLLKQKDFTGNFVLWPLPNRMRE